MCFYDPQSVGSDPKSDIQARDKRRGSSPKAAYEPESLRIVVGIENRHEIHTVM